MSRFTWVIMTIILSLIRLPAKNGYILSSRAFFSRRVFHSGPSHPLLSSKRRVSQAPLKGGIAAISNSSSLVLGPEGSGRGVLPNKDYFNLLRKQQLSFLANSGTGLRDHSSTATGSSSSAASRPNQTSVINTSKVTGAFAKAWPQVLEPPLQYRKAERFALKNVQLDKTIKNQKNQYRKFAAHYLDCLMQELTKPISACLSLYSKNFKQLHPYETTVAQLTVIARAKKGLPPLERVLDRLKQLRSQTSNLAKSHIQLAKNATSLAQAKEVLANATSELQALYYNETEISNSLLELSAIHRDLKRIPVIELDLPTIVLVGAPNVGKSSIVRTISTGTPEVNDYPFTTRGVTIGHIFLNEDGQEETNPNSLGASNRFQVMDTPGLLNRPDEERNEMEKLTFASLLHLPTAVIFVIDHTNLAGEKSTLENQLQIRKYLKTRFPKRPWIDVISKGDLPIIESEKQLMKQYGVIPVTSDFSLHKRSEQEATPALVISVQNGMNVDVLKLYVVNMLSYLKELLQVRKAEKREE